ncbi:HNH endonuclease [Salinibacter ruber]|uniref:HNH endonuclease n=1 Tax=Salinibacter ruber TaxID=146919 RepID=UPI0020733AD5|nr:HNH endonuclease [Salinibacter ruber]
MLWIEMSKGTDRPGPEDEWGLGRSLHSPARNTNGNRWAFWETLLRVEERDTIVHLYGDDRKRFVGFSTADSDGYKTRAKPPHSNYGYEDVERLYRVHLRDFRRFDHPYPLGDLFRNREEEIRRYYEKNKERESDKRRILPVVQGGRLQCLNGAYLSEADEEWREILFDFLGSELDERSESPESRVSPQQTISTSTESGEVERRHGQKEFSDTIKENYDFQCCFPGCEVEHRRFLIGAHIARWADAPKLRGQIDNGICLCLMHDKAFEYGWFTLTADHEIWVAEGRVRNSEWAQQHLLPWDGHAIDEALVMPGDRPLLQHWDRVDLYPTPTSS